MIDAIAQLVEEQIAKTVREQVDTVLGADEWLASLEQKILEYTQTCILSKFADASTMPEIIEAVKQSVSQLFDAGMIPGLEQFVDSAVVRATVDQDTIKKLVIQAVQENILDSVKELSLDPIWLSRIEKAVNDAVVQEIIARIGSIDINTVIRARVDESIDPFLEKLKNNFSTNGITDLATKTQLTITDDDTIFENQLNAQNLNITSAAVINDLVVKGSINVNNPSWDALSAEISQRTLDKVSAEWRDRLVDQIVDNIKTTGIDFDQVTVGGQPLVANRTLSENIVNSNLQSVGVLNQLKVGGEAHINNTVSVVKNRLGVNTDSPEMALSVWDEEVSLIAGKFKTQQAYIGTSRLQGLTLGVNRTASIEIDADGLTAIKKLQVGVHRISHDVQVPGWSGTRGDIVFNSNPGPDRVFAWVCLGNYKWQVLKSAE